MARKNDYIAEVDKYIGKRIHSLRLALGLSRQQLSEEIGVTHQQLQKYEKGTNRLTVGRLMLIGKALSKDISYFYEGFKEDNKTPIRTQHQRMCIEVSRNFMKLNSPEKQDAIHKLVKSLVKAA
jgi:transcriptional regulator with XRE-family HTH domain